MEDYEVFEQFFTQEGRLASFQSAQPTTGRKTTGKGKASKALTWPHKGIDADSLARAGFYFNPAPDYPDNTVCFLCHKMVGGWEDGDDPIVEHLRLSPNCGWAIVAAIEARTGDYNTEDPSLPHMIDARKATFGDRWPHEGKRGWKCKTKQMVDAGWKYTPTLESDDMATCTYCQLALDGWEPSDKPMHEHYKRSPECPFFLLINQYQQAPKKTGRGKGARASKASRLSSQSVATVASEAPSTLDQPADYEDSVMTTASVATTGGTKKGRAKKATTTAKGRKTKAKKEEPAEVLEEPLEDDLPPPPPKPARGRKRASDAMDDSVLTNAEAPAPKKRATRGRPSNTANEPSVIEPQLVEDMTDASPAPPAKTTKKKGTKTSKSTRKVSTASTMSNNSFHNAAEEFPDDEELDRQLQADLDRPLSDDEMITADSDSERKKAPAKAKGKKTTAKKAAPVVGEYTSDDHVMFEPAPAEMNDADASAELRQLQEQMAAEEQEPLQVPKKGRKAGTRKASKQTKAQKAQKAAPEPETQPDAEPSTVLEDTTMDQNDISAISSGTVVKQSMVAAPAPKKRGRPKKNSTQAAPPPPIPQPEPELATEDTQIKLPAEVDQVDFADPLEKAATPRVSLGPSKPRKKSLPPPPVPEDELQAPTTPGPAVSATPAARQATISPSQSPQSSDAENQPPSSRPSNTSASSRVGLIPEATTPVQSSPTKRNDNFLVALQSNKPWSPIDIDLIFEELGKENTVPGSNLLKGLQLTSPEQKMTVEEWIHHNANLAEQRLKVECEMMVSKFENAGGQAMRSLEELIVEQ